MYLFGGHFTFKFAGLLREETIKTNLKISELYFRKHILNVKIY